MGFLDIAGKALEKADKYCSDGMDRYNESYDRNSERYSNMSDNELFREKSRLSGGSSSFEKLGQGQALKEEFERRGY